MMEISADKKSLAVNMSASLTAEEVQQLIHDLATKRAQMLPHVSNEPSASDAHCLVQADAAMALAVRRDGTFRLWARSLGIGWQAFDISLEKACGLRDYLAANTPVKTASLVSNKLSGTNRAQ